MSWTQVGAAITRPGQLSLDGLDTSAGLYAPDLAYRDGRFFLFNTCLGCGGNHVVTASNPAGPWSDPVWLPFEGIDPAIFFDADGRAWLVATVTALGSVRPSWRHARADDIGGDEPQIQSQAAEPGSPLQLVTPGDRLVVMMYVRYPLSLRNVEDLLFERGIDLCHETVRQWWKRFGPMFAGDIRRQRVSRMRGFRRWGRHLDEMYVKLNGEMVYLWRAVDHEGEILESYVTRTRDKDAAVSFMKKALKRHGSPEAITTDGLRSYGAAMKELGNADKQEIGRWANNRVENSHLPFRRRERAMLRFRRMKTLQKFASVHANVHNHFALERHLVDRTTYKERRSAALAGGRRSRARPPPPKPDLHPGEIGSH